MKAIIFQGSTLLFLLAVLFLVLAPQQFTQQIRSGNTTNNENRSQLDINSKAQELGITAKQLEGLLNSAVINNGGGDPLPDAMQRATYINGQAADDFFGVSVSSAGDVNSDGYDDIIIGAYMNDFGNTNAGRAYIYFGGETIDNIPDVILNSEYADNGKFGVSVSGAGDVNGDGYDDVIVGAPGTDYGGVDAGTFYIFFGGDPMDANVDLYKDGYGAGDYLGSVSTAGDVNSDGYDDVIIGAEGNDAGGTNAGRSYIYYGGVPMNNIVDVILTGAAAGDQFGGSVSTAGDVNGDGYNDVIVGARYNDAGGTEAGRAYIYYGGDNMDNTADVILTGVAAGNFFGLSVSTAGDVNGDGYSDVIVGTPFFGSAGFAYIFLGGSAMNNFPDVVMTGQATGDIFGVSVSAAGDVNGDGFSDVIIGADKNGAGGTNAGRAYIYFGGADMDNIADVIITGDAAGDLFGNSVSSAGDMNGDGYNDVIVGAYANDAGGVDAGRAYLYTNSLTGTDIPDEFFTGAAAGDFFGSVSSAGDVNGDGYPDVIVGAFQNDAGGSNAGRAYIYFGGTILNNTADVEMAGSFAGDYFGCSVSTAGDVNGDGYSDVIVGASGAGGINAGWVYIYYGGSNMNNIADIILTGAAANDNFGSSVSEAGDVNGDGYSDIIVGACQYGATDWGTAYIYFGGVIMDNISDVLLTGEDAYDVFGLSVSTAGDLNGDGYDDVIVGANNVYVPTTDPGRAYIYFGGVPMDNTEDLILTGTAADDHFGTSVSSAGDVNGDGYSDVIVGAYQNDAGGSNAGSAYIFLGGTSLDNIADIILNGIDGDSFGGSVSSAGDVNGDGYADIIVGANTNDAGGNNAGRAYIFFGSTVMDNVADVIMIGAVADDYFGGSVSSAGDVNSDGYSDVIVGADQNDAGGINAGRAYLYLSSSPPIKPRIISVKDVPFDQGGQVKLKWVRSGYDVQGISMITVYLIQRSDPPDVNGFAWETIASMIASNEPFYLYVAETPNDSMTNNSGTYYFRVTARTSDPNQYWRSNIMSGHSVDNLAPLPPFNFYASLQTSQVKLGWKANTEEDFKNYILYRTDVPNANPDTLDVFATVMDTTYIDSNPLIGNSYYFLRAQDVHNNLSAAVIDSIIEQTTFALIVSVNNGWNMVSIPGLHPVNQNVNTWWQYRDPSANVFKYSGGYVIVTTATPGTGYWMKHTGVRVYNTGEEWPAIQIVSHSPINASVGWNMFGGYEEVVAAAGLTTTPPGLISGPVYGYSGGYYIVTNLQPGYGYWVKLSGAGVINIPDALAKGKEEVVEWFKDDWGRIILTDAAGVSYTLYAVKGEVDLSQYELPPAPMEGMSDIRFSSGRIAEDINSSMQTIDMSGVTYPLTVKVEGMDIRLMDETGKTVNVNLKSGENVIISDATIQKLMVSAQLIPVKYALEQNYPNPFNPSTVIEFSLPEDVGNVKLSIYNTLGEKVTELVNTALVAGKYQYQWNAQNVATGMYIYELRTDKFVGVKKMILIK